MSNDILSQQIQNDSFEGMFIRSEKSSKHKIHALNLKLHLKGSVQQCVKFEIDVWRKEAANVLKIVIHIRICKWPNDDIIIVALIF